MLRLRTWREAERRTVSTLAKRTGAAAGWLSACLFQEERVIFNTWRVERVVIRPHPDDEMIILDEERAAVVVDALHLALLTIQTDGLRLHVPTSTERGSQHAVVAKQ